ncbi:hypothetical protein ACH5RR_011969 [Cinchona calisaya]|uniref:Uncharacterized protein n=1 Tax=Cinchona calisaya TaxID=153742 RepID=A0ABD3ACA9_9GENT
MVNELMIGRKWNEELIKRTFTAEDAQKVLMIPLSIYKRRDKLYRFRGKTGVYSVKSRYAALKEDRGRDGGTTNRRGETNRRARASGIWKRNYRE